MGTMARSLTLGRTLSRVHDRKSDEPAFGRPSLGLLARELAVLARMQRRARQLPPVTLPAAARPRKVLVIPGFLADDRSCGRLIASLRTAGHQVEGWQNGRNLGHDAGIFTHLARRTEQLGDGQPVTLVGWSLGGLMAREFAKEQPRLVERVVTAGSPFSGDTVASSHAGFLYRLLAGRKGMSEAASRDLAAKPPVETVAIWSVRDGIVADWAARGNEGERDRAVELSCGHLELVWCESAIRSIAKQLI